MWFNGKFNNITKVYQTGGTEDNGIKMLNIETPASLLIWQFRIKTFEKYEFVTSGFNVEIGQLIKVLKFLKVCYL